MSSAMLVFDTRVMGQPPLIAPNTNRVGENVSIADGFSWISTYARQNGGLTDLYIIAHGIYAGVHDGVAQVSAVEGGFGIQIFRENLTFRTVSQARVLQGLVSVITLYSCEVARTRPHFNNTSADGALFCKELAAHTGAEVIGATQPQRYQMVGPKKIIDLGAWEGPVHRFSPDGTVVRHFT